MIQGYQIFNKLSVRVFITMWLSIAVMISLTVLLPRFDQRRILPTPEKERLYYASKITYMLFNNPTDHYQDNLDDAKLIRLLSQVIFLSATMPFIILTATPSPTLSLIH